MGKLLDSWHSGQVTRKHTMMNIRAENVAEHTWGVVHLLLSCYPNPPMRLVVGTEYHDFGEWATGDMPGNVRWANPVINDTLEAMEAVHCEKNLPAWIWALMQELTPVDYLVIEIFDRAEFCLSQSRERRLGNSYAMIYFNRSFDRLGQKIDELRRIPHDLPQEVMKNIGDMYLEIRAEKMVLDNL